ncbi:retrovirus-related pol polyprotein from type-1 retrotransposable element r2 [Plakobranchus ocellatus]|uniref:Retrovirus-related pol polyprotein from type-1 retrotransposable element r2 n=2 Tax=Plakobranchus ocellatus TaxID=259542 RepID=A0AAV4A3N7_9GAST|nr:retrovirus-related pol polyprotein from type-1 retrotransposable element r2 [Plakobranchus ocellatus]
MERMKLNILGLSKVRWKGAGKITLGGHKIIYSGGTESEKGVGIIVDQTVTKAIKGYWALSDRVLLVKIAGKPVDLNIIQVYAPTANSNDEDLDKFYNELDTAKTQSKSQDPPIIMGDFNAKVGTEKVDDIVGKHRLGIRNEQGEKLIEWCQTNNIIVGNTWFQQHPRRKWTWKSPGDETRNQIDYMMISKRYRNALLLAKTYPSVDCYSDHVPVVGKFKLKLKKNSKPFTNIKFDLAILKTNQTIREKYQISVRNKFEALGHAEEEEVETAIKKMKHGKATGPDNISLELIEALEDFGIGKVTHLLNEIYDTGQIPTDLSKSIFIALPKKPGATECELHRTISLMSHITKVLLKIGMLRIRNKIKPEIAEEQCGFVEDKGTSNAIYILRTFIERALEVQKDVYLCFIDYTKAFDRICHDEIITELKQLKIDGKDLRIIKTMYWEQTAAMRIENKTSTFQDIKRGVRQGCVLSPDLFSLYSEIIMRNLENHPGIKVGGQNINNLRYADDTVLIAENKEDLQKLLNIVEEESRKKGLELNSKKTEVMVISRKQESPKCDIFINKVKLKQKKFKYLGTIISNDGKTKQRNISKNCSGKDQLSKDENNPDK